MKSSMTPATVHKQYEESLSAFRRHIAGPEVRAAVTRQADDFFRTCALGVWQADGNPVTPTHVEYFGAIYCKGNPVPATLFWELGTQVSEYPGFQPPPFFQTMLEYDKTFGKTLSRRFGDLMTLMLLLFAAVDDRVSDGEAAFVNACADRLTLLCDRAGISGGSSGVNAADFVSKAPQPLQPAAAPAGEGQTTSRPDEAEAAAPVPDLDTLLAQLDELCGLEKVKADVKSLINLVKVRKLRQEQALPVPPMSLHLVFLGNPGTGKTTVARLLAQIYHAIGVLSKGQLVEVDRSGLVAGFVGQTALKTQEVIQKALGGVLFIDEAYALANQESPNDFGREAIEVLLKGMEDHRDDLIVIVAGYTELMDRFIHANPGLESRFNKYFYFQDYTGDQLMEIFRSMCLKHGYTLDPEAESYAQEGFGDLYDNRDENFGNARDVRNIFERSVSRQSDRVAQLEAPTKEDLMALTRSDLQGEEEDRPAAPEEISPPEKEGGSP